MKIAYTFILSVMMILPATSFAQDAFCEEVAVGAAAGLAMASKLKKEYQLIDQTFTNRFEVFDVSIGKPDEGAQHAVAKLRVQIIPEGDNKRTFYVNVGDNNCHIWSMYEAVD